MLLHKAIDHWRKDKQTPFTPDSVLASRATDDDPAALVLSSISVEQIWKEMKSMPPARYRVAYLAWACGWTIREISFALGIAESTVRVHKHHAVKALRALTFPLFYDDVNERAAMSVDKSGGRCGRDE